MAPMGDILLLWILIGYLVAAFVLGYILLCGIGLFLPSAVKEYRHYKTIRLFLSAAFPIYTIVNLALLSATTPDLSSTYSYGEDAESYARKEVWLPAEADILSFYHGDWGGDYQISFKLPPTKSSEEWLERIWNQNEDQFKRQYTSGKFYRYTNEIGINGIGVARVSITYTTVTGIYQIYHYFDS